MRIERGKENPPLILSNEVKVVPSDGNRTGHFSAVDSSGKDAPSDRNISSEGALLVDVCT